MAPCPRLFPSLLHCAMLNTKFSPSRIARISGFVVGILLSVTACGLLAVHAGSFSLKRDTAVMIGTTLPELRSAVVLLRANREAEQFFTQHALASLEEQASVYVFPDVPSASRAILSVQTIVQSLPPACRSLKLASLSFDPVTVDLGAYTTVRASMQMTGSYRCVARLLAILSFSGHMMVRDVLPSSTADALLATVESQSPLSLKTAEDFLFMDLLSYALQPDIAEASLFRDLSTAVKADLTGLLASSPLSVLRAAFDAVDASRFDHTVWPLPLLSVQHIVREGDLWTIDLQLYRR